LAEKNNPKFLEPKDIDDFAYVYGLTHHNSFLNLFHGQCRKLSALLNTPVPSGNEAAEDRYYFSILYSAMQLVGQIAGDKTLFSDEDRLALAKFFPENYSSLFVFDLANPFYALQQRIAADQQPLHITSAKFGKDPKFQALANSLPQKIQSTFENYNRRFNLEIPQPAFPAGTVVVRDHVSPAVPGKTSEEVDESTAHFDPLTGTIFYGAEGLVQWGTASLDHEVHHFWLWSVCRDTGVYQALPRWFREGFAVYASGQLDQKKYEALSSKSLDFFVTPSNYMTETGHLSNKITFAAGLASQTVLEKIGNRGFELLMQKMNAGESFEKALGEVRKEWSSPQKLESFLAESVQRTLKKKYETPEREAYWKAVETIWPEVRQHFNQDGSMIGIVAYRLRRPIQSQKLQQIKDVWKAFISRYPNGIYSAVAHYFLGILETRSGENKKALTHFAEAAKDPDILPTFLREIRYYQIVLGDASPEEKTKELKKLLQYCSTPRLQQWILKRLGSQ